MAQPQPGPLGIEFLDYTPPRRFAAGARVGNVVYLAGETPRDPNSGEFVPGDIREQTELVFQNIGARTSDNNRCIPHTCSRRS